MPRLEFHALVPNVERTAFLVDTDDRLPAVVVDVETRWIAAAVDAFRDVHALDAVFLRVARWVGEPVHLLEFDAPASAPHGRWRDLDALVAIAPPDLAADAERWSREQRGGAVPPLRSPWARPGWHAEATRWIGETLGAAEVEVFRVWPLSAVLIATTTGGERFWFKAAFAPFAHEPAVTQTLSREHHGYVPEVVAVDLERGWMVMRELTGHDYGVDEPEAALRALAEIHRAWLGREREARALRAPDRSLRALGEELETVAPADAVPALRRRLEELESVMPGETLVHGDFHPWNVRGERDRLVVFDWSDACVAHPLFDLPTFFHDELGPEAVVDAYARARDDLDGDVVREAFALAHALACVHHAISYRRIEHALEPADRGLFAGVDEQFLERAVAAL